MLLADEDQATPVPGRISTSSSGSISNTTSNWLSEGRRGRLNQRSALSAVRLKRFCPYQKTVTDSRKLFSSLSCSRHVRSTRSRRSDVSDAAPADVDDNTTRDLVNKTWRIHRVSPMYRFSAKPSALKVYSRHLSAHIESAATKKIIGIEESADFAQIRLFKAKCATSETAESLEGIEIVLLQKPKHSNSPARIVLTALLYFATNSANADMTLGGIESPFTVLPLLLIRGPAKLVGILFPWWQAQFDCRIIPLKLSPMELSWIVAMFSGFAPGVRARPVELVYKLPDEVTELSKIVYTINAQDCKRLWKSIHSDDDDDYFRSDEVVSFVLALEKHFFQHFKVKLAALQLVRVGTSTLYVSCDGALKMFSEGHVLQILSHLDQVVRRQPGGATDD